MANVEYSSTYTVGIEVQKYPPVLQEIRRHFLLYSAPDANYRCFDDLMIRTPTAQKGATQLWADSLRHSTAATSWSLEQTSDTMKA